jgi:hypothetical protein
MAELNAKEGAIWTELAESNKEIAALRKEVLEGDQRIIDTLNVNQAERAADREQAAERKAEREAAQSTLAGDWLDDL